MKPYWQLAALVALVAAGGLALRLPRLSQRPMHGDEAVHTVKFDTLWTTGKYVYDPQEYHGPVLYYATLPAMWLSGTRSYAKTSETTFRVVPVAFGVGLILLLPLLADGLGRGAVLSAAVLIALSPALVFYSRYYIQETLLAFFTLAAIAAGWRYARRRRAGWAVLAGISIGLMHATKETCLIAFACLAAALALTSALRRYERTTVERASEPASGQSASHDRPASASRRHSVPIVAGALAAVLVSVLFYSSFGQNPRGPWDSLRSYATYFDRAAGHGLHDHPWYYYWHLLLAWRERPGPWWSEAFIAILAALGLIVVATGRHGASSPGLIRFLALYAVLMAVAYSAIPYKTPWCLLQFWPPLILLAGLGAASLLRWVRSRPLQILIGLALFAATAHLGWQAWRSTDWRRYGYRNPYVYAHPLTDVVRLAGWVERLAQVHPDGHLMLVKVIAPDPWPLPWHLRRLERVGYWETPPADAEAPIVIASNDVEPAVQAALRGQYEAYAYGLRPDVMLWLRVDSALWRAYVEVEDRNRHEP